MFFKKGDYAFTAVQYADSANQPFAITELLTLGSTVQLPVDFTGAAMVSLDTLVSIPDF
jgi:hypothetical protein